MTSIKMHKISSAHQRNEKHLAYEIFYPTLNRALQPIKRSTFKNSYGIVDVVLVVIDNVPHT